MKSGYLGRDSGVWRAAGHPQRGSKQWQTPEIPRRLPSFRGRKKESRWAIGPSRGARLRMRFDALRTPTVLDLSCAHQRPKLALLQNLANLSFCYTYITDKRSCPIGPRTQDCNLLRLRGRIIPQSDAIDFL